MNRNTHFLSPHRRRAALLIGSLALLSGCGDGSTVDNTIFAKLGEPLPSATPAQLESFERGRAVATGRFTDATGLGPDFNVVACANCHEKPVIGGGGPRYRDFLLVRQVLSDGSVFDTGINGVQPQYTLGEGGRRPTDPGTNLTANRNPPPFFGVGLLAELPEDVILAHADETDIDGDGISGRANFDRGFAGRFGRKAQTVSIEGFIRGPLFNHLGITTNPLPEELKAALPVPSSANGLPPVAPSLREIVTSLADSLIAVAHAQVAAPETPNFDDDGIPDPEMSDQQLFDLVSFSMLLAAPQPDPPSLNSVQGFQHFQDIGCASCHVPSLEGPRGPIPAYSDLLLHDMGEELADGIAMGLATGSEFRTQPLWGIAAVAPYLHDGRADTLDEAIRLHGGESSASRDSYVALPGRHRDQVIAFLESLGGLEERSAGLLPPDSPILPVGELGGPTHRLSAAAKERFLQGRAVFDRDVPRSDGLGPRFNGDSCRSCHFDPVIGGSGPADVDVTRQAYFVYGTFVVPNEGSMAHRHQTDGQRPPRTLSRARFDTRQTPSLFGLGFLESIPEEDILANSDCDNPDPSAVSGCAHILDDGRVGRLGWRAQVPDLAEFARDAMLNELGVTLPEIAGQTFGATEDDDTTSDPEISRDDLEALVFFMQRLAAPPRSSSDAVAEAAGEALFESTGCGDCHRSEFVSPEGLRPYTDLLLHQVILNLPQGFVEGDVGPIELRTPPLWGLSQTGPYMHDGRAFTVEAAIERHASEALASRDAFDALSNQERSDLLAFLASL
jgi:CxxC motif-containing protein (DUF1111 family)